MSNNRGIGSGSATINPGAVNDNAGVTIGPITVAGAVPGDYADIAAPYDLQGLTVGAYSVVSGMSTSISSGTSPPALTYSGTPTTAVASLFVQCTTGGTVASGNARVKVSYDGGVTFPDTGVVVASSVAVSNGLTLLFAAGTLSTNNTWAAYPIAAVYARLHNKTGSTVTLASGTWKARIVR